MKKRVKVILIVLFVLILAFLALLIGYKYYSNNNDTKTYKQEDVIKEYNYTLDDRDSKLMKSKFNELKSVLKKDSIDYKEYAKLLAELYVIDIFTMNNKINKYDTPSLEYILDDNKDNFSNNITDTLYKYMLDDSDGLREQELPSVKEINYISTEDFNYTYKDVSYNGYKIMLEWTYEKDYGYDTSAIVDIINKDNKLYVVGYEGA